MNTTTPNRNELLDLLLINKEAFELAVLKRQDTSTGNKELHQRVLAAYDIGWIPDLCDAVFDDFYFVKPLEGVIWCMEIDDDFKMLIMDTYNKIKREMKV